CNQNAYCRKNQFCIMLVTLRKHGDAAGLISPLRKALS
ncbi:hypothetical protein, partial [Salmonella enterica subsp. enterica serovar Enteritidis]